MLHRCNVFHHAPYGHESLSLHLNASRLQ
jgi:hypothetical protein